MPLRHLRKNSVEIVLFNPEIPQNTGNIARTCVVTGSELTLIRPLGFSLSDRQLKRAGLDYWEELAPKVYDSFVMEDRPTYFFSTKGERLYTSIDFTEEDRLVFGAESQGLPSYIHKTWPKKIFSIPMVEGSRSLNLSNAVALVLYEALRQTGFKGLR